MPTTDRVRRRLVLRDRMIERARDDPGCTAAALVGSAARGAEDEWSDIDLALQRAPDVTADRLLSEWGAWLDRQAGVVDHLDVHAWGATYRVFLCVDAVQVDLSVWPPDCLRAVEGRALVPLFGEPAPPEAPSDPDWRHTTRTAWLYLLHAHTAIRRGRVLQADWFLSCSRERVMSLAAVRLCLEPGQGREAHLLPRDVQHGLAAARPASLEPAELRGALRRTVELYLAEVERRDAGYAESLLGTLGPMSDMR